MRLLIKALVFLTWIPDADYGTVEDNRIQLRSKPLNLHMWNEFSRTNSIGANTRYKNHVQIQELQPCLDAISFNGQNRLSPVPQRGTTLFYRSDISIHSCSSCLHSQSRRRAPESTHHSVYTYLCPPYVNINTFPFRNTGNFSSIR